MLLLLLNMFHKRKIKEIIDLAKTLWLFVLKAFQWNVFCSMENWRSLMSASKILFNPYKNHVYLVNLKSF